MTIRLFSPFLLYNVFALIALFAISDPLNESHLPIILLSVIFSGICLIWSAVSYHRYILIDDHPGFVFPPLRLKRLISYFGHIIKMLFLLAPFLFLMVFALNSIKMDISAFPVLVPVFGIVISIPIYRLSIILPAAALGQPLSIRGAWVATKGASLSLLGLVLISLLAGIILGLPAFFFGTTTVGLVLAAAWNAVVQIVSTMVGVSILTTLYGFYVEKRPIGTLVPS